MAKFKGGTSLHSNGGYIKFTAGPLRDQFVHVVIAEAMLGRKLRDDEHVHHKDGNVRNPHHSNLIVLGKDVHNAISNRQYHYLKNFVVRPEAAAWAAYFEITGCTPDEWSVEAYQIPQANSCQNLPA